MTNSLEKRLINLWPQTLHISDGNKCTTSTFNGLSMVTESVVKILELWYKYKPSASQWIGSTFMQSVCILEAFVYIWWLTLAPGRGTDQKWGCCCRTLGTNCSTVRPKSVVCGSLYCKFNAKGDSETIPIVAQVYFEVAFSILHYFHLMLSLVF